MKRPSLLVAAASLWPLAAAAQGTLVYDQQSEDEAHIAGAFVGIQAFTPMGQSFTPTIPSVGFVRQYMADGNFGNSLGAVLLLTLRSNTVTGPVLASSTPVSLPDSFVGTVDFFFPGGVPVTPGATYCFQPVVQSGD